MKIDFLDISILFGQQDLLWHKMAVNVLPHCFVKIDWLKTFYIKALEYEKKDFFDILILFV